MFEGYKSGFEFEEGLVDYLRKFGFEANRTGKSDSGIDIVAVSNTVPNKYTFNIQCKYQNAPLGKRAVQEVYTGTAYYGNGGKPVVVTNNHVTAETRVFAKRLGVEIIADIEWTEIQQVHEAQKIINPNIRKGLMGIILATITRDRRYLTAAVTDAPKLPTDKEKLKLELINDFDTAEEYVKEAAYLQQRASEFTQKALTLQKEALLKNLEYG